MFLIKELIIYPIKGLKGISVKKAYAEERGFRNDRRYVLVDEDGNFQSQRNSSTMALIHQTITDQTLEISYKDYSYTLDLGTVGETKMDIYMFDHCFPGTRVSPEVDAFFSDIFGKKLHLLHQEKEDVRNKSLIIDPGTSQVSFADGYPYLTLGTASIEKLNNQLDTPFLFNRFRPNIYIETDKAHVEDEWKEMSMGEAHLRNVKPCVRCTVTTINQESGKKGKEPLKTLAKYRKQGDGVIFGSNAICTQAGWVEVGNSVITS